MPHSERNLPSWAELAEASLFCAIGAGIAGTVAWGLLNHVWPGAAPATHRSVIDVILQSDSVAELIGNMIATVFIAAFIAFVASLWAAPVALLIILPAYAVLRRAGLASIPVLTVIGVIAGTLYFWGTVTDLIPFYGYQGREKLVVAALIGGVAGFVGALIFFKSAGNPR